ncbi:GNAT family N-acetyltransferase [Bizionia gelidisalsuginis]|uniref:GNAT family N-acetyltransferase n=2 Tax=Bizionia TaxID=283785 RepID=A0A8H2LB76_9FLAO|nr:MULTISPECIES: GNAT family N-acetyltransferase [Bizionia]TYB69546.1 GNAT family N-acetyltransferase [Bizionia saleffrena]TYC09238.1 GNAT family N-acetyltransferase [Bizionia gelidisalsuginis]
MIAVFDAYHIAKIEAHDAQKIHILLDSNYEYFETYFPKTLAQNLTEALSESFVTKKIEQFKNRDELLFTIKKTITGDIIGLVYIKNLDWENKHGEFAYCIDRQIQNKGVGTKAIQALSKYAFNTLTLDRLVAIIDKNNIASIKVVKNTGFTWTSTLENIFKPTQHPPLDMELYTLHNER